MRGGKSVFFFWMLHGSMKVVVRAALLSAKTKWKSQIHWKGFSTKATNLKNTTKQNHQPRCSLPESAGEGGWSLFLSREARTRRKPGLGPLHQPWREAWRDHFGSVYGGAGRWQRIDKEATKDDRRTGRQMGGGDGGKVGGTTGRERPQQAR